MSYATRSYMNHNMINGGGPSSDSDEFDDSPPPKIISWIVGILVSITLVLIILLILKFPSNTHYNTTRNGEPAYFCHGCSKYTKDERHYHFEWHQVKYSKSYIVRKGKHGRDSYRAYKHYTKTNIEFSSRIVLERGDLVKLGIFKDDIKLFKVKNKEGQEVWSAQL